MKETINLKEIRKQNATKLEELLSSTTKLHKAAKKMYGDKWQMIYSGEKHPLNLSRRK